MKTFTHFQHSLSVSLTAVLFLVGLLAPVRSLGQPGALDVSFQPPPGLGRIGAVALPLDGRVVVAGSDGLFRLHPDGSLDPVFAGTVPPLPTVYAMALQADGKILIGGSHLLLRLEASGALDPTFAPSQVPDGEVVTLVAQADGRVLVGGFFNSINGDYRPALARLLPDGTTDFEFNPIVTPRDIVQTLLELSDGRILVSRYSSDGQGHAFNSLLRLRADGSADNTFNPPMADSLIYAATVQPDGRIVLGGGFSSVNGAARVGVARVQANGQLDAGFKARVDQSYQVRALAVQPDGRIIIGGAFRSIGGVPRPMLARLNANGSLDNQFDARMCCANEDLVYDIKLQNDGRVLIGGGFTSVGGAALPSVARLRNDRFAARITFAASRSFLDERAGFATIAVLRTGDDSRAASVQFLAEPGTARAGEDFVKQNILVSFAAGESVKLVTVPVRDDTSNEGSETVRLTLKGPKGAQLGDPSSAVLTILDSERE